MKKRTILLGLLANVLLWAFLLVGLEGCSSSDKCQRNSDCPRESKWCIGGSCSECSDDSDCSFGKLCKEFACVSGTRQGDSDGGQQSNPDTIGSTPDTTTHPQDTTETPDSTIGPPEQSTPDNSTPQEQGSVDKGSPDKGIPSNPLAGLCLIKCSTVKDCCPTSIRRAGGNCDPYVLPFACKDGACQSAKCNSDAQCNHMHSSSTLYRKGYSCQKSGACLIKCSTINDCCPESIRKAGKDCSPYVRSYSCQNGVCQSGKCASDADCLRMLGAGTYRRGYGCNQHSYCQIKCSTTDDCCPESVRKSGGNCSTFTKRFHCQGGFCQNIKCKTDSQCNAINNGNLYPLGYRCMP